MKGCLEKTHHFCKFRYLRQFSIVVYLQHCCSTLIWHTLNSSVARLVMKFITHCGWEGFAPVAARLLQSIPNKKRSAAGIPETALMYAHLSMNCTGSWTYKAVSSVACMQGSKEDRELLTLLEEKLSLEEVAHFRAGLAAKYSRWGFAVSNSVSIPYKSSHDLRLLQEQIWPATIPWLFHSLIYQPSFSSLVSLMRPMLVLLV